MYLESLTVVGLGRGVDNFQEVGGGGLDYWQEQWPRPLMPPHLLYDAKIWGGGG